MADSKVIESSAVSSIAQKEAKFGITLILPGAIVILALIFYPIIYNIYLSFFDVRQLADNIPVGFDNFANILGDGEFWGAVGTTVLFVIFSTLGSTILGLVVAIVMNKEFRLRGLVRSLILFPYVAPVIAVVFAWQNFFDPVIGQFNYLIVEQLGLASERFNLINNPNTGLSVVIIFNIWRAFPFSYLMILSRLQAIDKNLYEAAEIDGANGWQKFRAITVPEIQFVVGALVLLRMVWNFNKFEEIFLLTGINVKVLSVYTYQKAFIGIQEFGTAAALSVVQFVILIGVILLYVKKVLKW